MSNTSMLNDKRIHGTGLSEYLQDINSANTKDKLSDIIIKNRQALYSLFSFDVAEGTGDTYEKLKKGDEDLLKKISDALKSKKNTYQDALGHKKGFDTQTDAISIFDLRNDETIFQLWKYFSGKIDHNKRFVKKNVETRKKILDTIKIYNRLQWKINKDAATVYDGDFGASPKLLKGRESGDDASDVLKNNTLEAALKSKDGSTWEKNISRVIEKGGDGLSITTGVGGLQDKENQYIARRAFVGLWLLYYAAEHSSEDFSEDQIKQIDQYLTQIQQKEIPCIKTIHSVDYQTYYMDELHDKLRDLNQKDPAYTRETITKDSKNTEIDLTDLFENGSATNIENYALIGEHIKVIQNDGNTISGAVVLRDGSGQDNSKSESGNKDITRKIIWKVGGEEITLGSIFIDNKTIGSAKASIVLNDLSSFQENIQKNILTGKMPISIQIPIKAIKQAKVSGHNAARTKHIQLEMTSWEISPTPTPTPTPTPGDKSIEIKAHIMDKESLVKKSIEQDVLEEYQHKYEKRRWPQRLAMYTYGRFMQNRRINKHLRNAKGYSGAIETQSDRQQRVSSSIGNFAGEFDMGLDEGKVTKTELTENDEVNNLADQYIKGTISRDEAITQFNDFFNNNSDYQSGMTGTDIMEQLDDIAIMVAIEDSIKTSNTRTTEDRKNIQQALSRFYASHNGPAVIHGVSFKNPKLATTTEIDALCDKCLAYKSKVTTGKLRDITAKVKLYKIEKDTVDLTQSALRKNNKTALDSVLGFANGLTFGVGGMILGNPRGRAGVKTALGAAGIAAGFGALPVVGGVAGFAAVVQGIKTYRDYLTEAQKTHEDAMTMGTKELDKRIKDLEKQVKNHHIFQKFLSIWGFGKHAIRTKQLNILNAVNDKMHKSGAIKPAAQLIQELQQANRNAQGTAIAETLARLKAGRELNTNFISGTTRGVTEQERRQLLLQLRKSASERAQKLGYGHIVPTNTESEAEWKTFWTNILALPGNNIGTLYQRKYDDLKKNFAAMKKDINKGRARMAFRDTATNLATSAAVLGIGAGVSAGINARHGGTAGTPGSTFQGPHNEYALGKYETPVVDKSPGWENALNNGDKVSFQGEASVDAIHATTKTFGNISSEIASTQTLAKAFDATTQEAVHNALTIELMKVKAEAIAAGADAGNIQLVQQRWIDGVEEMLTKLQAAGKTGVTIENIQFDPSTFGPIDIQASGSGAQDIIDRSVAFTATVDGMPGSRATGEPLRVVWPGFSNTYAKAGPKKDVHDSWSKSDIDGDDDSRVRPRSKKGKQRREREKELKEHEKLMNKNKEYKEAYERYEQTRKHEEAMEALLANKKRQLEEIEGIMNNIAGEQDKIEELQRKKKQIDSDIINIQQNIDKSTKNLYNNQVELKKIIEQDGGARSQ